MLIVPAVVISISACHIRVVGLTLSAGGKKGKWGMNGEVIEMQLAGFSVFSFCVLQQ